MEYNITIPKDMDIPVFVEHGQFDCVKCKYRCDCELTYTMNPIAFEIDKKKQSL